MRRGQLRYGIRCLSPSRHKKGLAARERERESKPTGTSTLASLYPPPTSMTESTSSRTSRASLGEKTKAGPEVSQRLAKDETLPPQLDEKTALDDPDDDAAAAAESSAEEGSSEEHDLLSGFRLLVVMAAITTAVFLQLMDLSIIATVSPSGSLLMLP